MNILVLSTVEGIQYDTVSEIIVAILGLCGGRAGWDGG